MSREQKDRLLFNGIANNYSKKDLILSSSLAREAQLNFALARYLENNQSLGTIVDIGCGIGAPARYLSGCYDHYIGIDQSVALIDCAKNFYRDFTNTSFYAENIKATKIESNVADFILSIGALHHMSELDKVFEKLVNIAKPDAIMIIIEPQSGNPVINLMRWIRGWVDKEYSREQISFSETNLKKLLDRHCLTDIKFTYQGYLSTPFAQVIVSSNIAIVTLSKWAIKLDQLLQSHLKGKLRKMSFNIIVTAKFPR
jgi:SAM-dependent methyltransferase